MIDKLKGLAFPALVLWILIITLNSFLGFEMAPVVLWATAGLILFAFANYVIKMRIFPYIVSRFIEAFLTLLAVATFTFLLLRVLPGGPFDQEKTLPPEVMANIAKKYNLDAPVYEQYFDYITGVFTLDFGESYKYIGRPITEMLAESMPASIELGIYSLILAFLIGIPSGVYAASRHNKNSDRILMFFAISGIALPVFVVSPILILIFCYKFELLPAAMWSGTSFYILPVIALGTRPAATIARLTRASVLEVIASDYIRTAKAKGLSETAVLFKHVLKNSLIPVLTYAGPLVAGLLSGSFIIEQIHATPGLAKHFVQSVTNRDYPLIMGVTLLYSTILITSNLLVDILYSYFDPRIKLS